MKQIDLNSDMGESFGKYKLGDDEEIMKYISSTNIACGFHAGDPHVLKHTILLAKETGTAVGAHPGLPDLVGFGRRSMDVTPVSRYWQHANIRWWGCSGRGSEHMYARGHARSGRDDQGAQREYRSKGSPGGSRRNAGLITANGCWLTICIRV